MGLSQFFPSLANTWKKIQHFDKELQLHNIVTPSAPDASHNSLYFKGTDKLFMQDSGGTETELSTFVDGATIDPTFNDVTLDKIITNVETISSSASIEIDFTTAELAKITSLAHAPTFTTASVGRVAGAKKRILIICDGTNRAFTFSESWKWLTAVPTTATASKNGVLTLECLGTANTDVWASWAEQP